MDNKIIYIILVIIVIVVICIFIYLYNKDNNKINKINTNNNNNEIMSMKSMASKLYTPKNNYHNINLDNNELGNLFSPCPCKDNLECVKGICKRKNEDDCLFNR